MKFFYFFVGHFRLAGSGSGSMDPMESGCRSETMVITLDYIIVYVLYVLNLTLWFQAARKAGEVALYWQEFKEGWSLLELWQWEE